MDSVRPVLVLTKQKQLNMKLKKNNIYGNMENVKHWGCSWQNTVQKCKMKKRKTVNSFEEWERTKISRKTYHFYGLRDSVACYDVNSTHVSPWFQFNSNENNCNSSLPSRRWPADSKSMCKLKGSGIGKPVWGETYETEDLDSLSVKTSWRMQQLWQYDVRRPLEEKTDSGYRTTPKHGWFSLKSCSGWT